MTSPAALHSVSSSSWFTPPEIIEAAREMMGGIDLDPASEPAAQAHVRAERALYAGALEADWTTARKIWLNPPSPPREWWSKLANVGLGVGGMQGTYMAYSLEQLSQSQKWAPLSMLQFSVCIPKARIRYLRTAADALAVCELKLKFYGGEPSTILQKERDRLAALPPDSLVPGPSPSHASAIVGLGMGLDKFAAHFGKFGQCFGGAK